MATQTRSSRMWTALVTVWIVWGTTYLAIAVVVRSMPPLLSAGVRFLVAGALMYGWSVRRGDRRGDHPTGAQWRSAAIIGGLLLLVSNGLIMTAERKVPSGLTALIVAMVPLWVALSDRLLFGRRLPRLAVVGLVTGFGGAALLVGGQIAGDTDVVATFMVVAAALSWVAGSLYARDANLPSRPLVGTGMEMLCGGAFLMIVGTIVGEWSRMQPETFQASSVVALVYLIVFGSLVGFTSYVWLIRNAPTSLASTYAYVNPVVAVTLGWLILSEPLTLRMIVAGLVIIVSVALIVTSQGRPASASEEAENVRAASGE
jgi:drug/metabolite transporter (DMT)-like permease